MTLKEFSVAVASDERGVLIFHIPTSKVPEGIQILRAVGGGVTPTPKATVEEAPDQCEKLKNTRLGFDSVLAMCSIADVVVYEGANEYCRVYVNWEIDPARPGYNSWGETEYKMFLRSLFAGTFNVVKIRRDGKKVSLVFSAARAAGPVETKIVFAPA